MGLFVQDQAAYGRYRAAMTPLLEAYGGFFAYDFEVGRVLISETPEPINRVFLIRFPDQTSHDRFFADPHYLEVKARYFETAVGDVTPLGRFKL